jgi:hypothetical protein
MALLRDHGVGYHYPVSPVELFFFFQDPELPDLANERTLCHRRAI